MISIAKLSSDFVQVAVCALIAEVPRIKDLYLLHAHSPTTDVSVLTNVAERVQHFVTAQGFDITQWVCLQSDSFGSITQAITRAVSSSQKKATSALRVFVDLFVEGNKGMPESVAMPRATAENKMFFKILEDFVKVVSSQLITIRFSADYSFIFCSLSLYVWVSVFCFYVWFSQFLCLVLMLVISCSSGGPVEQHRCEFAVGPKNCCRHSFCGLDVAVAAEAL